MKGFHHWAHATLTMELNAAKEIKALRNELQVSSSTTL